MAGKVSRPGTFWIGQEDVSQVPFIGEVAVSDGDADRQDLAHRLRVDHEMIRVGVGRHGRRPRQSEEVRVVLFLLQTSV